MKRAAVIILVPALIALMADCMRGLAGFCDATNQYFNMKNGIDVWKVEAITNLEFNNIIPHCNIFRSGSLRFINICAGYLVLSNQISNIPSYQPVLVEFNIEVADSNSFPVFLYIGYGLYRKSYSLDSNKLSPAFFQSRFRLVSQPGLIFDDRFSINQNPVYDTSAFKPLPNDNVDSGLCKCWYLTNTNPINFSVIAFYPPVNSRVCVMLNPDAGLSCGYSYGGSFSSEATNSVYFDSIHICNCSPYDVRITDVKVRKAY